MKSPNIWAVTREEMNQLRPFNRHYIGIDIPYPYSYCKLNRTTSCSQNFQKKRLKNNTRCINRHGTLTIPGTDVPFIMQRMKKMTNYIYFDERKPHRERSTLKIHKHLKY